MKRLSSVSKKSGAVHRAEEGIEDVSHARRENTIAVAAAIIVLGTILSSLLFYMFGADRVIESIYKGTAPGFLNSFIKDRSDPLDYYLGKGKLIFSRLVIMGVAAELGLLVTVLHRRTLRILKAFFTTATHPLNLGLFRIFVFWQILRLVKPSEAIWYSRVPAELQFAPWGVRAILRHLPVTEQWATICTVLLLMFSFTALIGLFSRLSALLCVIVGFYALGIPQFYGKVNHYHHLLWFAAILAASRCGDFLSIDAILAARKRADQGIIDPPGPSRIYALPLRFVWLLIGILYFFPGFWKLWESGFAWALSDNLKYQLYLKWIELGWMPVFRVDRYPLLYQLGAAATILFETCFIFFIFFPKLRVVAALGGITFHKMINLLMRIDFQILYSCYVAFFDWKFIFQALGRCLYREQMYLVYDGNCRMCRRTISSLRVLDIFERVTYLNAFNKEAITDHGLGWLDPTALMTDMHAVIQHKSWTGFLAYRALARRIPALCPALPLLYLWPVRAVGKRIYRHVADSRTCKIARTPSVRTKVQSDNSQLAAVTAIGIVLILGNLFCGVNNLVDAWPFSCYPSFMEIAGPRTSSLTIVATTSTGEMIPVDRTKMSSERLRGLIEHVLGTKDPELRMTRLKAMWRLWVQNDVRLQQAAFVQFYKDTLWTIPELWKNNPVSRELLLEINLRPCAGALGADVPHGGRAAAGAGRILRAVQPALDRPALGLPHAGPGPATTPCAGSRGKDLS